MAALGMFSSIAFFVVFVFLLYHIHLIAKGTTTNEVFKWEDVNDAITANPNLFSELRALKEDTGTGKSNAGRRRMKKQAKENTERMTEGSVPYKPRNEYNHGFLANLKEVLFPKAF